MNLERAKQILGEDTFIEGGGLFMGAPWILWTPGYHRNEVCLDGDFTVEDLEAIVWVMRNGYVNGSPPESNG